MIRLPAKPSCIKLIDTLGWKITSAAPARTDIRGAHGGAQKDTETEREAKKKIERYIKRLLGRNTHNGT